MDDDGPVESILKDQREEFRDIRDRSQRFLQVLIALLAVGFVFARPEWINFFSGSDVPKTDLTHVCASGGRIMGLQETMVAYNGFILHSLLLLSLLLAGVSAFWAARIQFISPPVYLPSLGYSQINLNRERIRRANRLFKLAHYAVGYGILSIFLTAAGYLAFYQIGDVFILLFDVVVLVFIVGLAVQGIRLLRDEHGREVLLYEFEQSGWTLKLASLAVSLILGIVIAFAVTPLTFWLSLC